MIEDPAVIRSDFDRIARLSDDTWNHNGNYHDFLLRQLPPRCGRGLDIGCGTGAFSRLLRKQCESVLGLDLSPEMVRIAREQSMGQSGLDYQVADALAYPLPERAFDCVVSIATLHHLPYETALARMKEVLAPGGVLLVLDLFHAQSPGDFVVGAIAFPLNLVRNLVRNGRLNPPPEVRAAWDAHGRHDHYLPLAQMRAVAARLLPGAQLRRHLFWRYSLVWRKPA